MAYSRSADTKIFGAEGVAERMLPYTGGKPQPRYAILVYNLRGGAGFEVWEPRGRELNYVSFEPALGDLGIYACKIKSRNVRAAYAQLGKAEGARLLTEVTKTPDGREHFFLYDPWNNLFEVETDGAVLGVTDMDKSVKFYSTLMDYDKVEYDVTGLQADLNGVPGGQYPLRRVLLSRSKPIEGPLSEVMGTSHIELVQRIPEGYWGDPGFIHLCFDIRNMEAIRETAESLGHSFVCDGGRDFKMGEADGHFTYVEDPDGTLIEFVETFKVPILKKWGIYLHLEKRDPHKQLPRYMTRALRFLRSK